MITINEWLKKAKSRLEIFVNYFRGEEELFLSEVTGMSKEYIISFKEKNINNFFLKKLEKILIRRENEEPIAYILGSREFWSLNIKVSRFTLIPRIESECVVEQSLNCLGNKKHLKVLDLGTGTGAIALAIASEQKTWKVTGVDFILNLINLAYENSKILKIKNVEFIYSNWFSSLNNIKYNLIVSNPPYLSLNDFYKYRKYINFEPLSSLVSKNNGLKDIFFICKNSKKHLFNYGWLIIEHGYKQGEKVRNFFIKLNFKNVKTINDYSNKERVTIGQIIN